MMVGMTQGDVQVRDETKKRERDVRVCMFSGKRVVTAG